MTLSDKFDAADVALTLIQDLLRAKKTRLNPTERRINELVHATLKHVHPPRAQPVTVDRFMSHLQELTDDAQRRYRVTANPADARTCPECLSYLTETLSSMRPGEKRPPSTYYCRYFNLHANGRAKYFVIERGVQREVNVVFQPTMIDMPYRYVESKPEDAQ